jgi:hypothetical protein
MARTLPFQSNGVSGIVREKIGEDIWLEDVVMARLPNDLGGGFAHPQRRFAEFLLLTEQVEGLSFEWPVFTASVDVPALYQQWRVLPPALMRAWGDAIDAVSEVISDEATAPSVDPND